MSMICKSCGFLLPDGSRTCPKCGTKQVSIRAGSARTRECSEKNQLMVRVQGHGVYFILDGEYLCRYDEENGGVEVLTEDDARTTLCGLGYSGGKLYFWHECLDERSNLYGMHLLERDPETGETRVVWDGGEETFSNYRLDDDLQGARAILNKGAYYLLDHTDQSLMRISLPDGRQENFHLPDMRLKMPLYDWIKPRGCVDLQINEENFGLNFTGLNIVDGQVYLALDGFPTYTLRYPLENSEQTMYFPPNTCPAVRGEKLGGMLTSHGSRIFFCPTSYQSSPEIGIYELGPDGHLVKLIGSETDDVILVNKSGAWWRVGNTVYVGQVALNLAERKWHKLSYRFFDTYEHLNNTFGEVRDFFPGRGSSVYLMTDDELYLVPQDWEDQIRSVAEIDRFRVVSFNDL